MSIKKSAPQALIHASELLTGVGVRQKDGRKVKEEDLGRLSDGAIVYTKEKILWVGSTAEFPKKYSKIKKKNLKNKFAVIPGLVDCHTHLVFAGNRAEEFAARCAGATYQEIAAKGGGILSTVRATQAATLVELERLAVLRAKEMAAFGVKTIEVKSGYGLKAETEIKILEVVKRLKKRFPQLTFQSTFLGAHAIPQEMSRAQYVHELIERMLPEIAKKKLAESCDIFIDEGYFTLEDGRALLGRAKELGLSIKIHADELANTESAALAAELGALSADHLLKISDRGIEALAQSQTVGVLLPGTALYLKAAYAPARKLIEAGACVAISTDFNPGSCMCLSLPAVMTLAALYMGMTRSEIFAAVTYNAAKALGLESRKGTLEAGKDSDFSVLPFSCFEEMYYRFAWSAPH